MVWEERGGQKNGKVVIGWGGVGTFGQGGATKK